MSLEVDPARVSRDGQTGIFVRAKLGESWGNHDIAELTTASLVTWLTSGPKIATRVVGMLLDHDRGVIDAALGGDGE